MRKLTLFLTMVCMLNLAACSLYQPELKQGNDISQVKMDKLKVKMTKSQVQGIMGTPAIIPVLDLNRWDYTYASLSGTERDKELNFKMLTLYFKDDKLEGFSGEYVPKNLPRLKIKEKLL